MTDPLTTATCTDEQRAEWFALHDQMQELSKTKARAEEDAVYYLREHISVGAMTPGPFGTPSVEALDSYHRACEHSVKATAAWAEWERLHAQSKAHPYNGEVESRSGAA